MNLEPGSKDRPLCVAIIGAGPAGFYAAAALQGKQKELGLHSRIDMFDHLIAPHGLVRYGVAPDHDKIKAVAKVFDRTAADPNFRYFGNVEFGRDLCHGDLRQRYDAVIYSTGAQSDRRLGIPGEDLPNSFSATEFVAWYNSHPDFANFTPDLSVTSAVVVGVGNVALDVARILAKSATELQHTDIADHTLAALMRSNIRDIYVLARRGPAQVKFTPTEIKEFGELYEAEPIVAAADIQLDADSERLASSDSEMQRILTTLRSFAAQPTANKARRVHFRFLLSPVEIVADNAGRIAAVKCERNQLALNERGDDLQALGTGEYETIPAGLVLRSVGYRGVALPDVPFDAKRGVIPNVAGRVIDANGAVVAGEYVAGWIKRGPSGVIGTNRPDALETINQLVADLPSLTPAPNPDPQGVVDLLTERGVRYVSLVDWQKIHQVETAQGEKQGRPAVKITDRAAMLKLL